MLDEINMAKLVNVLKQEEGYKPTPYVCPTGHASIGNGTNLEAWPAFLRDYPDIAADVAAGRIAGLQLVQRLIGVGMKWSREKSEATLVAVLEKTTQELFKAMPWINDMAASREAVFMDMAYNMGLPRLFGFKKTLALAKDENWEAAADEMLRSRWAAQVGGRSIRLSNWMRLGEIV